MKKRSTCSLDSTTHLQSEPGRLDIRERLLSKIVIVGECWVWQGLSLPKGYGRIHYQNREWLTHRLMYELEVGPIPEGLNILHSCDNPPCINPAHLTSGTQAENLADMDAKGRRIPFKRDGERNPRAKLTDAQALEMRALFKQGVSVKELIKRFDSKLGRVERVVYGLSFKHLL